MPFFLVSVIIISLLFRFSDLKLVSLSEQSGSGFVCFTLQHLHFSFSHFISIYNIFSSS